MCSLLLAWLSVCLWLVYLTSLSISLQLSCNLVVCGCCFAAQNMLLDHARDGDARPEPTKGHCALTLGEMQTVLPALCDPCLCLNPVLMLFWGSELTRVPSSFCLLLFV